MNQELLERVNRIIAITESLLNDPITTHSIDSALKLESIIKIANDVKDEIKEDLLKAIEVLRKDEK